MNKSDLIDAVSGRMGDKRTATEAVNAVLDTIQETVARGDKVSITGFGVFEKQERAARTARNPATGAAVKVPKTSVPKFRAGRTLRPWSTSPAVAEHALRRARPGRSVAARRHGRPRGRRGRPLGLPKVLADSLGGLVARVRAGSQRPPA
jgi:DNA-binding protein HU-beta